MTNTEGRLALGLDIGGTSTRALVIDESGRRLGAGRSAGANLTSHALDRALDAVSAALDEALADVDPAAVGNAVVGAAGDRNLAVPAVAEAFAERWRRAGLSCPYTVVADALVAFVAGTPAPSGTLVLSGTGALAAQAEHRRLVRLHDAHGWLLGDLGSGFWLGREAVRSTLRTLDRHRAPGPLGAAVIRELLGDNKVTAVGRGAVGDLILAVHAQPPVALSALAPLVTGHAGTDPEADRILRDAAHLLLAGAEDVREPGDTTPIVLTGSLLTADTPLAALVRDGLAERWPGAPVSAATDGAAGAAWLAAVTEQDEASATDLHAALFAAPSP
ncbi:N-acetylglucosamine kinase [Jiangella gansuensis]|uniref:N-acetylglucosamine kinase n=1 Tax=Jiangella gansuensis TaxID=281473 RepID=UPI00047EE03F|nr:BadF/BadG/BcrA/BcrD ATPase family protein [Jiangella gansuensis]